MSEQNKISVPAIDLTETISLANSQVESYDKSVITIQIKSQKDYDNVIEYIRNIEKYRDALEEKRKSITQPIDQAKKAVMDLFRPIITKCDSLSGLLRQRKDEFDRVVEADRQKKQKELEDKAERERQVALQKAQEAKEAGDIKKAEKYENKAADITVPIVANKIEQPKGTFIQKRWHARVTDLNLVPREWLIPNMDSLEKYARAVEGKILIPGVEFYTESITTIRKN